MLSLLRLSALSAFTLSMFEPGDPLLGPGVSKELAAQRAAQISGVRYDLQLSVVARDTARGSIVVRFKTNKAGDVILDFRGPSLTNVRVNGATANTKFNGAHLFVPAVAVRVGDNSISADFKTLIAPAGASIIRFHDDKDASDYLYTLLVPSDANLLFPCFDQPDLKARMTLRLSVPPGWRAIANGRTLGADSSAAGV